MCLTLTLFSGGWWLHSFCLCKCLDQGFSCYIQFYFCLLEKKFMYVYLFSFCFSSIFSFLSRFCLSETSCSQEDNYPSGLCIKVNGKLFPLPVSDSLNIKKVQLLFYFKETSKAFYSCRVMHRHQKMEWNRRDREGL